jgi:phosphoribosylcarboxyaminoimidazole (NCAIR) mutase
MNQGQLRPHVLSAVRTADQNIHVISGFSRSVNEDIAVSGGNAELPVIYRSFGEKPIGPILKGTQYRDVGN